MTRRRHVTARLADLEREDGWAPIRRALGIEAFGVNAWTAREPQASVIPEHDERPSGHEELYLVTAGHARFTVAGEPVDAPAGTLVFVGDPADVRGAVALVAGTTVLSIGAPRGEGYRARSWEVDRDVIPLLDAGDHEQARRLLLDALDRYEDRAGLLYNLACAEAQLGELDAAREHLDEAIALRPDLAEAARDDEDLAPLR